MPSAVVDHLSLLVHHVIVFQQTFPNGKVVLLDLLLGTLHGLVEHRVLQHLVRRAELFHPARYSLAAELAHQVVFQRDKELRRAGISLTSGTTAKLAIDAPGFMALGAKNMKSTDFLYTGSELNIRSATCHVRGDCNCPLLPCLRDNLCL